MKFREEDAKHPFQVGLAYPSHWANYYNLYTQHPLKYLPSNFLPGVPNPQPSRVQTDTSYQISGSIRLEIKYTTNVMCLNHPETVPWSKAKPLLFSISLHRRYHLTPGK